MSLRSVFGRSHLAEAFWALVEQFPTLQPREADKDSVIWFSPDYSEISQFSQACSTRFGVSVTVKVWGTGWLVSVPRRLPQV